MLPPLPWQSRMCPAGGACSVVTHHPKSRSPSSALKCRSRCRRPKSAGVCAISFSGKYVSEPIAARAMCSRAVPIKVLCRQRHRGLGRDDAEAEALLQIQPDDVGIVRVVADREVLAGFEQEVASPEADNHRTPGAGSPHEWTLDDPAQVIEQQIPAVFGGLDHPAVLLASERHPVWPGDPVALKALDGAGD